MVPVQHSTCSETVAALHYPKLNLEPSQVGYSFDVDPAGREAKTRIGWSSCKDVVLSGNIMDTKAILSLTSGVTIVVATLVGVALMNPPHAADAAVIQGSLVQCPLAEVQIDQGYGLSSKALRPICGSTAVSH